MGRCSCCWPRKWGDVHHKVIMATHVLHIATISLCSSHCDNMVMANHVQPLSTMVNHSQPWSWSIATLSIWLWPTIVNHSQPLSTMVNGHGQYRCVRHIVTIWIWPTMFNHCQPWSTIVNHGHGQSRSTIFMFVTLWQYGYVHHIICSTYKVRFVCCFFTLWKILLWRLMFFTSRQYHCVRHIVTIWLWPTMFNHC